MAFILFVKKVNTHNDNMLEKIDYIKQFLYDGDEMESNKVNILHIQNKKNHIKKYTFQICDNNNKFIELEGYLNDNDEDDCNNDYIEFCNYVWIDKKNNIIKKYIINPKAKINNDLCYLLLSKDDYLKYKKIMNTRKIVYEMGEVKIALLLSTICDKLNIDMNEIHTFFENNEHNLKE
jgi:hypothetical protein